MNAKKIILALSAVAFGVFGLERVGAYRFIPEGDLHVEANVLNNPTRLSLRTDSGELKAWVRLTVMAHSTQPLSLTALGWPGEPIDIVAQRLSSDRWQLTIAKFPLARQGSLFDWPAGVPLEIGFGSTVNGPVTVEDWGIYSSKKESDTRTKAQQRWWWTRISWALLSLSLLGGVVTALSLKDEVPAITTEALVRTIVRSIEGKDTEETKKIRRFLTKVLLNMTPPLEALGSEGYIASDTRRWGPFLARASSLFRNRVTIVRQDLNRYSDYLNL